MLKASGVPTAVGFKGAAEAAEAKSAVAHIMEGIVFIPNFLAGPNVIFCVAAGHTGRFVCVVISSSWPAERPHLARDRPYRLCRPSPLSHLEAPARREVGGHPR